MHGMFAPKLTTQFGSYMFLFSELSWLIWGADIIGATAYGGSICTLGLGPARKKTITRGCILGRIWTDRRIRLLASRIKAVTVAADASCKHSTYCTSLSFLLLSKPALCMQQQTSYTLVGEGACFILLVWAGTNSWFKWCESDLANQVLHRRLSAQSACAMTSWRRVPRENSEVKERLARQALRFAARSALLDNTNQISSIVAEVCSSNIQVV